MTRATSDSAEEQLRMFIDKFDPKSPDHDSRRAQSPA